MSSQFRVSFFFFCDSYEIQSIQHVFTINACAWYLSFFYFAWYWYSLIGLQTICSAEFFFCLLLNKNKFNYRSIILFSFDYSGLPLLSFDFIWRNRVVLAFTPIAIRIDHGTKEKLHNLFLKSIIFSFSEYYDYELHVVEWGYVNKQLIEKKNKK